MSTLWMNIPLDLRNLHQWAICAGDKIPRNTVGTPINVSDPTQFMTFESAANAAFSRGWNVGFILSENDPFTCLDLDVKDQSNCADRSKWTPQNTHDLYWRIIQSLNSYTEYSRSGKGFHIWVRAKVKSCRRDGVEIYSNARFIITTGNIINNLPIADTQSILDNMISQMEISETDNAYELEEFEPTETTEQVINKLMNCASKEKFCALASGHWQNPAYPSQSEADMALMSIIAAHTKSNAQVREIFRLTELGKRAKAIRNDVYLNRTLKQIRARQKAEESLIDDID